jgi:hypothetical protein
MRSVNRRKGSEICLFANSSMLRQFGLLGNGFSSSGIRVFSKLLRRGLTKRNGGLYWKATVPKKISPVGSKFFPNLSCYEYLANKIHVEDFYSIRKVPMTALLVSAVSLAVEAGLRSLWIMNTITRQIVSLDLEARACIHSFHSVRSGESYLDENLEKYKEPVMCIDVQKLSVSGHKSV